MMCYRSILIFVLCGSMAAYAQPNNPQNILLEAENTTYCQGWRLVPGKSGDALQDDAARGEGILRYDLYLKRAGRYYVHLLCMAPEKNTSKNDCFLLLNDERLLASKDSTIRPEGIRVHSSQFVWSALPKGPGAHTPNAIRNGQVYFSVAKPGAYQLQVISRSKGFVLDKILLRLDRPELPQDIDLLPSRQPENSLPYAGQWDVFEVSVEHEKDYPNPFVDVQLSGRFFSPSGRFFQIRGFYDGQRGWKIRFMPDQLGIWEYELAFSDGSGQWKGTFECRASDIPGMITTYRDNPIWFGYKNGEPMLVRSLHLGDRFFATQGNALTDETWGSAQRTELLNWAQEQGYNTLSIASHYLNREQESRGLGWDTPDLWDEKQQRPNPKAFHQLEPMLDDLKDRKLIVYPFAGFFGRGSDFPREVSQQDLFLDYTMARLGAYWNLLYNVAGPEPLMRRVPFLSPEQVDELARKIKTKDPYGHLLSVHNRTGDDAFITYPWNDYGILQGPKTTDRQRLGTGILRNHHPGRPLYLQETLWPGNIHGHPEYSMEDIRKNALVMLICGGSINFGDMNGNSSSGFSGTLDLDQRVQERHDLIHDVWDFFASKPYFRMKPRQDLVENGYCLAEEGRYYLIYAEGNRPFGLKLIPGRYLGQWIDPMDLSEARDIETFNEKAVPVPPEPERDWLLYLWRQ